MYVLQASIQYKSPSFPFALLLFPSHFSPDAHLCSKYLTYSQLGLTNPKSPTQKSLAGFTVEVLTEEKEGKKGHSRIRGLMNSLCSTEVCSYLL